MKTCGNHNCEAFQRKDAFSPAQVKCEYCDSTLVELDRPGLVPKVPNATPESPFIQIRIKRSHALIIALGLIGTIVTLLLVLPPKQEPTRNEKLTRITGRATPVWCEAKGRPPRDWPLPRVFIGELKPIKGESRLIRLEVCSARLVARRWEIDFAVEEASPLRVERASGYFLPDPGELAVVGLDAFNVSTSTRVAVLIPMKHDGELLGQ